MKVNVICTLKWTALIVGLWVAAGCAPALDNTKLPERITLPNGITALLKPFPDTGIVAMEAVYEVGFLDESAGQTQVAHLMEHLVCYGATPGFEEKESMKQLSAMGMANAETLPDWTHYDYVVPADQLDFALGIEAERLASLEFNQPLVEAESRRCYQETDQVERNPQSGMLKHAFMALNQAWRHGRDTALVRGGLETLNLDELRSWHQQHYQPKNLTLVFAGDFDSAEIKQLLTNRFSGVQATSNAAETRFRMTRLSATKKVSWDANVSGVSLAYPAPENALESVTLSLLGTVVLTELYGEASLKELSPSVFCSNRLWPVGRMPFFVYAAAKKDVPLSDLEAALKTAFRERLQANFGKWSNIRRLARQITYQVQAVTDFNLQEQAGQVAAAQGISQEIAFQTVLAQTALNLAVWNRLFGPDPARTIEQIEAMTSQQFQSMAQNYFSEDRMVVTHIVPK